VASSGPTPTGPHLSCAGGSRAGRRSHQSRVEGQNHLPQPAGHTTFDAAQDMVGFLDCERTLVTHVQVFIHQHPHVLLGRAALNPFSAQPVFVVGTALTHVQDLALGLVVFCLNKCMVGFREQKLRLALF